MVMYIGQALKDVLKLPLPLSPPVVKLEKRVDAEYGLPSTHVMASTAIFFTLLLSAPSRVQFQFEVGLLVAGVLSVLVCLSRLCTGMHSALDVICGALISATLMLVTYPYWETFNWLQFTSPLSLVGALVLALFLSCTYPELGHYTTTRGDTTTILGVGAGCSVGYWVNERLGKTFEPQVGATHTPASTDTGSLSPGQRPLCGGCRGVGGDSTDNEDSRSVGAVHLVWSVSQRHRRQEKEGDRGAV